MGTGMESRVLWEGNILPLRDNDFLSQSRMELILGACRTSLEAQHLTPLGKPAIAVRPVDDWVRDIWVEAGKDPDELESNVLLLVFKCVHNGGPN